MEHLVLTVIAPDRPGLVEALADCVAAQGGNWLESRMAHLAGQFAGILSVEVEPELRNGLVETLQQLAIPGLRILVGEPGQPAPVGAPLVQLDLLGNDRVGIVRDITRALHQVGVNVERLSTETRPAPMSSEVLFHATALLELPADLELEALQAHLETLTDDLMVELKLYRHGHD
ncbi:ACT domain-containing protein [uncultured Pseudomonas sp.]|uniref:glycine cleavage system protein R n=1 Tax=uncultured Pseudomonas sp. TaxID=114707 RepID=UPI002590C049|nr:ACT domain-containing protein [uncultured Pseudomonas sp.]